MLYVIESDTRGRVNEAIPCDNGIDEAIDVIVSRLGHPEEDERGVYDVVAACWKEAVEDGEHLGVDPYKLFSVGRRTRATLYGLVSIGA